MNIKKTYELSMKNFYEAQPTSLFLDKDVYCEWLAQTYFFVRHSTALLGFAMPHLKNEALRHHFEHHLAEEERHDTMLLKDLERMGRKITDFQEMPETQAFYQSQYYRIQFECGTALLGYILFLEGLAANWAKDSYDKIKDVHKGSVLFLKVHAEEDPQHLQDAMKTILALPEDQQACILNNLKFTECIYHKMIQNMAIKKKERQAA